MDQIATMKHFASVWAQVARPHGRREMAWYRLLAHVWQFPLFSVKLKCIHSFFTWNNIRTRYSKVVYVGTKLKKKSYNKKTLTQIEKLAIVSDTNGKTSKDNCVATLPCTQLNLICLWSSMQMTAPNSILTYQN